MKSGIACALGAVAGFVAGYLFCSKNRDKELQEKIDKTAEDTAKFIVDAWDKVGEKNLTNYLKVLISSIPVSKGDLIIERAKQT